MSRVGNWNDYAPPAGRHHISLAAHVSQLADSLQKTAVSGHLLACGPITHLLAIVYMVFPSGSRMGSPEVFLGAFHPMHPLWDQWLVNITNYLKILQIT